MAEPLILKRASASREHISDRRCRTRDANSTVTRIYRPDAGSCGASTLGGGAGAGKGSPRSGGGGGGGRPEPLAAGRQRRIRHGGMAFGGGMNRAAIDRREYPPDRVMQIA